MEAESPYNGDAGERPNWHLRIFSSHFLDLTVFNDNRKSSIHYTIRFLIHVEATHMEKKRMRRKAIHSASRKWGWIAWNGFHLRSYCLSARQYRGPIRFLVTTKELYKRVRPSVYRYLRLSIGTSVCWHIMLELSGLLGAANAVYTVLSKIMMISLSSLSCSLSSSLSSTTHTRQIKYHN